MTYEYVYNLETGLEASKDGILETGIFWGIRYYQSQDSLMVEIGDGYRHEVFLEAKYWNKIMDFIKENKDDDLNQAIIKGLINKSVYGDFYENLLKAIKENRIKIA